MVWCIGFSKIWREKIYNIIKKLRDSNGIKWLRTRIYYHRFPNLGEHLQGDLVSKIRRNLAYKYSLDRACNCNTNTKVKGRCAYGGECQGCCVIYKVTCKCCGNLYVGNTQNTQKKCNNTSKTQRKKSRIIRIWTLSLLTSLNILRKNQVHKNVAKLCLSIYFLR